MSDFSISFRLSLQRALWGAITPQLRAVAMGWTSEVGRARFVFDRRPTEEDRELVEDVETEVIADFGDEVTFEFAAVGDPAGKLALEPGESWWSFRKA